MADDRQRRALPPMGREKFLEGINEITIRTVRGRRSPHKPLLLLLALGRLVEDKERLAYFEELEEPLTNLLRQFGPFRQQYHPEYPFWWLRTDDGLWKVTSSGDIQVSDSGDASKTELRTKRAKGGFSEPVWNLLHDSLGLVNLELVQEAARKLLRKHFPESLHQDIRRATGLSSCGEEWIAPGVNFDPQFCEAVLRAYQRRCAVCEFDICLNDNLFGLQAAHIKWPSEGGPYQVTNGLALCPVHHKALDFGILGLGPISGGQEKYQIIVSEQVNGLSIAAKELRRLNRRPLDVPENPSLVPDQKYIDWHRNQVFQGDAIV